MSRRYYKPPIEQHIGAVIEAFGNAHGIQLGDRYPEVGQIVYDVRRMDLSHEITHSKIMHRMHERFVSGDSATAPLPPAC